MLKNTNEIITLYSISVVPQNFYYDMETIYQIGQFWNTGNNGTFPIYIYNFYGMSLMI